MTASMIQTSRLSPLEKALLLLPTAGGLIFGLAPLLIPGSFAAISGAPGNDPYIYRLAGAATFGYAVALILALSQDDWIQAHLLVIAVLTFNLASLYACIVEIVSGTANPVVYMIFATSIAIVAITSWVLTRHREVAAPAPDIARWFVWFLGIIALAGTAVGFVFLFFPAEIGHLFGYKATDIFLYRQGGAATLGYGVMGIFELRSRAWVALRLPIFMALVFNGISFVVTLLAILAGEPSLLPYIIGAVALFTTVGTLIALQRRGR
jgi:hypothetical protein